MKTSKSVCAWLAVLLFATYVCGLRGEIAQTETHEIYSVEELLQIGSGLDGWHAEDTYILMNDLDCSGYYFERTVIKVPFSGVFNGNGHIIRNMIIEGYGSEFAPESLFIESETEDVPGSGLFVINTGVIENLGLDDYVIMNAGDVVGGICAHNYGMIRRCYADGRITSLNQEIYGYRVGGLCGQSYGPEHPYGQSIVEDCYSSGQITLANFDLVGGLIGHSGALVRRCYSTTEIEIEWAEDIGIRLLDIEDDYYGMGTLLGRQGGNAITENCYCYLGAQTYGGAQPLSYEAMQLPQNFSGFDFEGIPEDGNQEVWKQTPGAGLCPALSWQTQSAPPVPMSPCIVSQSGDQLVEFNSSTVLGVTTESIAPLAYQWFHGESGDTSSPIPGATESTLITPPVMASSTYWVQISNAYGTAQSSTIKVLLLHRIYTMNDLLKIGSEEDNWNSNDGYMLMNDLDLSSTNFNSAVIQDNFDGIFNGNGHLIVGMNIDGALSSGSYLGLFAANYGVIENLGLEAFHITNALEYVGSLCVENFGVIRRCYAAGKIFGGAYGYTIGGLVGQSYGPDHADGQSLIEDCHTSGELHYDDNCDKVKIGGLIGHSGATVRRCYSTMRLNWRGSCEATAAVIGSEGGNSFTEHCYCYYWAGFPGSAHPLPTSEMSARSNYNGFDFVGVPGDGTEDIWTIYAGHTPILSWQNAPGMAPPSYSPETTLNGEGLPGNPFVIANRTDFDEFCGNASLIQGHYLMTADIDLADTNLFPAAVDRVFFGHFNGNGHSIANMRIIGDGSEAFSGLFVENYGVIENLGLTAFHITNIVYRTGAICAENYGTIRRCYAGGNIFCNDNSYTIGGLCGKSYDPDHAAGQSVIEDCYTTGNIFCGTSSETVGGLIGHSGSIIRRCYSTARIDRSERSEEIGALIGNEGENSLTESSYCYWAEVSGSATPLSTAEMILRESYAGFDFAGVPGDGAEETWTIFAGNTPVLSWQGIPGIAPPSYKPETTLSGEGLPGDPFIIADRADFEEFCNNDVLYIGHYLMTADIDISDTNYTDTVVQRGFYGTFNGGMKQLLNLNIDCMNNPYISLFRENYGVIENLGIVDFLITNAVFNTAALCADNYGIIRRCYTKGELYCDSPNNSVIGALCAQSYGTEHPYGQSLIEDCYTSGTIIYGDSNNRIGGLIGHSGALVRRCYSTIELTGPWGYDLGNLIGREDGNAITRDCYCSDVGQINRAAQPLTPEAMFEQTSYSGFDFTGTPNDGTNDIWQITSGLTPYLNGQSLAEYAILITTQPQSVSVAYSAPAAVTVVAQGDATLFYQWFEGERGDTTMPLTDATGATFTVTSVTNNIECWVLVSNAVGNAFSLTAEISYYYGIYTAEDLAKVGSDEDGWFSDVNYKLMNDLDLSEIIFDQALIPNDFYGCFDGNGHIIHNMQIDGIEGGSGLGLFSSNYGIIENLGLENYCISNATEYVGALCGKNYGRIQRCYTAGAITAIHEGFMSKVGGICGQSYGPDHAEGQSVIEDCYTTGTVQCGMMNFSTGGLIGHCGAYVRRCYSTVHLNASGFTDGLGVLVGSAGGNSDIQDCYTYYWGGPVWNAEALTTDEMLLQQSYHGFDFSGTSEDGTDDTWSITQGYSPRLSWQSGNGTPVPDYAPVTTLAGSGTAADPFIIAGLGDFKEFCDNCDLRLGHYRMTTDVDLSGEFFIESPVNLNFYGNFDGNGHVIDNMFVYSMSTEELLIPFCGLFAFNFGHIHDLGVNAYLIITETPDGVGGLVGANRGRISRCYTSGTILGEGEAQSVGGLVGQTFGPEHEGGQSMIEDCYSAGHVIVDFGYKIGGFAGHSGGVIRRCYSTTRVTINESQQPLMTMAQLFSESGTGGFTGSEGGHALTLDCYLYQWAGFPGSATPLDNQQMLKQSSYVGFDFSNTLLDGGADTWTMSANSCPRLSWQSGSESSVPEYTVPTTLSGKGTMNDPFIIANLEEFAEFAENPLLIMGYYKLTADIDLAEIPFSSSVINRVFGGHFDGNNHIIANMEINNLTSHTPLGLFAVLSGTVKNLGVENCFISNNSSAGNPTGALCGICDGGNIIDCHANGMIVGNGSYEVGGICGTVYYGSLQRCRFMGLVSGGEFVGGICGVLSESSAQGCFTDCAVNGLDGAYCAGGICGRAESSTIRNSYSRGAVMNATLAAGLCAEHIGGEIRDCYATGEAAYGLCASSYSAGSIINAFWDVDSSGTTTSAGGTGKTTAQMQDAFIFTAVGWDFFNTWYMNGYPELINCFNEDSFERWIAKEWALVHQREQNDTPADDNIPNLLKYACGLSATTAYNTQDMMTMSLDPLTSLFSIEYMESKLNQNVILQPIWSATLDQPWSTDNITMELLDESADHKLWRASIPLGASGFMRLRATVFEELQ